MIVGLGLGLGHMRTFVTDGGGDTPPVLTGPLDIAEPSGEAMYTADKAARHYWMLSAPGTTPTAAEIMAGTGAIAGTSASAFGYFDASDGSITATIDFPGGISVTGAVFSVVARVEPSGGWSNILRDTSVNVETAPLTATYLGTVKTYQGAPGLGTYDAGWYLVITGQRNGALTSITPPGQTAVTAAEVDIVPTAATGIKPMRAYIVQLTAQRSGNWVMASSGGSSYFISLYKLSAQPAVVAKNGDFVNNGAKTFAFNMAVQAGDVEIGALNGQVSPASAQDATDDVAQDATDQVVANHIYRVSSGVAPASGARLVYKDADAGVFSYASALAIVLRRAA